jgi:hypothetical protein
MLVAGIPGRIVRLLVGLVLFGVSMAMLVRAGLGLDPWNVLHQGISGRTGLSLGTVVVAVSLVVLALWIPLRQRPGWGTVANAVIVGVVVDAVLAVLPRIDHIAGQVALLAGGVLLNAVATALYIGAGFGAGPRDGLMTGLAARGHSVRVVRTVIEVSVLAGGWFLGGTVGLGTVVYAASIGPLVHQFLPRLTAGRPDPVPSRSGARIGARPGLAADS